MARTPITLPFQRTTQEEPGPRILFYSHDSFGLGHLRRSLTLAEALSDELPAASLLIATGSPCATSFPTADRVDVVKLPSITKEQSGAYAPRALPGSLQAILRLRRHILFETYLAFAPHLIIVDHQIVGLHEELVGVLEHALAHGVRTILGVRDVIDSPERVAIEWGSEICRWALRSAYDRVCVYGVPEVFDPRREYPIPPELSQRLEFMGYVVRRRGPCSPPALPSVRPRVLVTVGGGEDGAERIDAYLSCLALGKPAWDSVILTGPLLDAREARRLRRRAAELGHAQVHRFHADVPRLLAECDAVVGMAGYNTSAEILQSGKPAVFLPRSAPRLEQRIRADRFESLGIGRSLWSLELARLRAAVEAALEPSARTLRARAPQLRLDGAAALAAVAAELVAPSTSRNGHLERLVR